MQIIRTLAAGFAVLALATAGCSGDDDAPADRPADSETIDPPDDGNGALDGVDDSEIGDDGNGALDGAED